MARQRNRIRRQNTALFLQHSLLAGIRSAQDLLDLKHGSGLHNVFDPGRIVYAWQLHQNLVLTEAVLLNGRLAHTQRIDTVADGFNRLRNGLTLQIAEDLGLHGKRPRVVRAGSKVVLRQALVCDIQEIFARIRRDALQDNFVGTILRIRLGDVRESNLFLIQLLFEDFNRVVGVHINSVIHLHLQDQVSSAAQIQTKMNAVGHGREHALGRKALWNAEDPEQKHEQDPDDEYQLPKKILIHGKLSPKTLGCAAITSS